MGSKIKKSIAVVLIATFLMSMFVIAPGAAENENSNATVDTLDYSVSADNSFGELISEKINESGIQSAENENAESRISELTIEGKTAVVEYESTVDCTILVAIYDETTNQMLASGKSEALKNESTVNVEIVTDKMPEYFIAKAFILNKNNEPLSPAYSTSFYTEAIQKVNNLKATDFEEEKVLNLDDDDNTNFAVYGENTKVIEYKADSNIPVVIDEESGKYVFSNATVDLKSLSQGDIFSYNYDGNIIIVKIGTITVDGDTVTITETDTELEEVFDYVKIEMSQGVDECEVGDSNPQGISEYVERKKASSNSVGSSRSIDKPLDIDPDAKEFDLLNNSVISGKVYFDVGIKGKIYLSFDECYVDFVLDYTIGYSVSINAEIEEKTIKLTELKFRPFAGVKISFVPKLIFSASASIALDMSVNGKIGFGFSTDSGFSNKSSGPSTQSKIKIEGEVYLGVALEPSISVISKKIAVASAEARAGLHFEAELDTNREDDESFIHECKQCASGKLSIDLKLSADLKFFGSKKFHYSKTIFDKSYELCEFYYSFDYDEFDWTSCPHLKYRVNATVTKDGVPYPNATVMVYGDRYAENVGETDENGKLSFYLPDDLYVMDVEGSQAGFVIYGKGADVTLDVTEEPTKPTEPETTEPETTEPEITEPTTKDPSSEIIDSGNYGNSINWKLFGDGTLKIDGYSAIPDSDYSGVRPWREYRNIITKVIISNGVTRIGDYVFKYFTSLKDIIIPDSVISIGKYAFESCSSLININLPYGMKGIGPFAFFDCSELETVNIPNSVTDISNGVFGGCSSLRNIDIPFGVKKIGNSAFYKCSSLMDINIPNGITSIEASAFYGCSSLEKVDVPASVTSIGNSAFSCCTNLINVNIPDGIENINNHTFAWCSSLKEINIPNSVTSIGEEAFWGCTNLTNTTIPDSVTSIGALAFNRCSSLTSIYIPNSVTSIGTYAFSNCASLERIDVSENNQYYSSTNGLLFNYDKTELIACPANSKITSYRILDGVKQIDGEAFYGCVNLEDITMPSSIIEIGDFAFNDCTNLKKIYFEGDAPYTFGTGINDVCFKNVTATAYYPKDSYWVKTKLQNYGGDITWVPYDPNVPIIASTSKKLKSISLSSSQNTVKDTGISTVTAEYDNMVTNTDYIIAVVKDANAEDILSADNLLYIDQFTSDNEGKISVLLPVSSDVKDYEFVLFGPEKTALKGDVNSDGKVGIDDVTYIQKYLANLAEFTEEQMALADVNKDGEVNIDDATLIQKHLVGMAVIE